MALPGVARFPCNGLPRPPAVLPAPFLSPIVIRAWSLPEGVIPRVPLGPALQWHGCFPLGPNSTHTAVRKFRPLAMPLSPMVPLVMQLVPRRLAKLMLSYPSTGWTSLLVPAYAPWCRLPPAPVAPLAFRVRFRAGPPPVLRVRVVCGDSLAFGMNLMLCRLMPIRRAAMNPSLLPCLTSPLCIGSLVCSTLRLRPATLAPLTCLGTCIPPVGILATLPAPWLTSMNEGTTLFALSLMRLIISLRPFALCRPPWLLLENPRLPHLLSPRLPWTKRGIRSMPFLLLPPKERWVLSLKVLLLKPGDISIKLDPLQPSTWLRLFDPLRLLCPMFYPLLNLP